MYVLEEEITKLLKVRRIVFQMLRDRGYTVEDCDVNMSIEQFVEKFVKIIKKDDLFIHRKRGENPIDQIYVFFPEGWKVGVPVMKSCANRMRQDNVLCAILVIPVPMTAPAKAAVAQINSCFRMEIFEEGKVLFHITAHSKVTKQEKKEVLDKYLHGERNTGSVSIINFLHILVSSLLFSLGLLPRILASEPVARYFGLIKRKCNL